MTYAELAHFISDTAAGYLSGKRWFLRKGDEITGAVFIDGWTVRKSENEILVNSIVEVNFKSGGRDVYFMPLRLKRFGGGFDIRDIGDSKPYFDSFMDSFWAGRGFETLAGGECRIEFRNESGAPCRSTESVEQFGGELSNTLVFIDKKEVAKIYRRLAPGVNPDLEIHQKLGLPRPGAELPGGSPVPPLLGYVRYRGSGDREYVLAMVERYVGNDGDAWKYFLGGLEEYVKTNDAGSIVKDAEGLGATVAKLHFDLMKAFGSEDFTGSDVRDWEVRLKAAIDRAAAALPEIRDKAAELASMTGRVKDCGKKIRIHGDLHLGQILKTGTGYCVIDFEGEPLKTPEENRRKNSPLKDAAGILRSFNYASSYFIKTRSANTDAQINTGKAVPRSGAGAAHQWEEAAAGAFMESYIGAVRESGCGFLPGDDVSLKEMLALYKLEKALYELEYEINSRPDWTDVPVYGIKKTIEDLRRL